MSKVSVIITCYNLGCYLSEAIESVLVQSFSNWECIIVDDGSTDNTQKVAKYYSGLDERIKYYYKENSGVADSRNFGVQRTSGDFLLMLDADDKLGREYIQKTLQLLINDPNVRIAYADAHYFGLKSGEWKLPDYSVEELLKNNMIYVSALYRRFDFEKIGGYCNIGFEDWNFWLSFVDLYPEMKVGKVMEPLFFYRVRRKSRFVMDNKRFFDNVLFIYMNHRSIFDKFRINPIVQFGYLNAQKSFEYRVGSVLLKPLRIILNSIRSLNN